jgi:hypothetical protein
MRLKGRSVRVSDIPCVDFNAKLSEFVGGNSISELFFFCVSLPEHNRLEARSFLHNIHSVRVKEGSESFSPSKALP